MIDYRPIVAGDILAIAGSSWLSAGIIRATGGPCSHVGLLLSVDPPIVIEALSRVKTNPLDVSIAHARRAWILHDKSLTADQRRAIMYAACAMSADDYGYLDIAAQGLDALFKTTWPTDHMGWYLKYRRICSYVVARGYEAIQFRFGKKTDESVSPADVYGFAEANPTIFDINEIML